ncbi:hypothetical protein [Pseudoalteromonas sp. GB56]
MTNQLNPLLQQINRDKKIYVTMLGISFIAWLSTLGCMLFIGYTEYLEYLRIQSGFSVGMAKKADVNAALASLGYVALGISMMVAALTTVIVLVRQRSASLQDIQLRLALVEEMIASNNGR